MSRLGVSVVGLGVQEEEILAARAVHVAELMQARVSQ